MELDWLGVSHSYKLSPPRCSPFSYLPVHALQANFSLPRWFPFFINLSSSSEYTLILPHDLPLPFELLPPQNIQNTQIYLLAMHVLWTTSPVSHMHGRYLPNTLMVFFCWPANLPINLSLQLPFLFSPMCQLNTHMSTSLPKSRMVHHLNSGTPVLVCWATLVVPWLTVDWLVAHPAHATVYQVRSCPYSAHQLAGVFSPLLGWGLPLRSHVISDGIMLTVTGWQLAQRPVLPFKDLES